MNAPAKLPALPTVSDVEDAARQLRGVAIRTPLLESQFLNERLGGRLLIKAEPLQVSGSFKFRGAYNRISRLNAEERKRGIVAFSSGNHAQACAWASKITGTPAVIVMPSDAPKIKISNTRAYGAEVVLYDRHKEDREAIGRRYSDERGMTLVPPFNDPYIISGQGTIGLEIAAQCAERDIKPDAVLAPASGGGLISGISLAIKDRLPGTDVYCAEPDQMAEAFICDAVRTAYRPLRRCALEGARRRPRRRPDQGADAAQSRNRLGAVDDVRLRLRQPGRRRQPQRRSHGASARRRCPTACRRHHQPPVRLGPGRRGLGARAIKHR
jgi:cysteine synthase